MKIVGEDGTDAGGATTTEVSICKADEIGPTACPRVVEV